MRLGGRAFKGEREKKSLGLTHLSDTHVELDADDEEVSLLLAGGH